MLLLYWQENQEDLRVYIEWATESRRGAEKEESRISCKELLEEKCEKQLEYQNQILESKEQREMMK